MTEDKHDDIPDHVMERDLGKSPPSRSDDLPDDDEYGAVDPDFESDHLIFDQEEEDEG